MGKDKLFKFFLGMYLALSISICGYYYINPKPLYDVIKIMRIDSDGYAKEQKMYYNQEININTIDTKYIRIVKTNLNYDKFNYSVLIFIVGAIIIYSLFQVFIYKK
jgi:hypothetical protein